MASRVLVVEDDADLREVIVLALEQQGFAVEAAENGLDAMVSLAFRPCPDAVVLNLHMPVVSGADFIEAVRGDPALAALPVILVTGARVPPEVRRGADAVIAKPFEIDALTKAIERLVARTAASRPSPRL
jgi:CheY-like chemotaxis protein